MSSGLRPSKWRNEFRTHRARECLYNSQRHQVLSLTVVISTGASRFLRCVVERSLHSVVAAIVSTKKNAAISPLPLRLATLRQGPVKMTPQKITKAFTEVLANR